MPGPLTPPVGTRFSTGTDLALLSGPTSTPSGAVIVSPGDAGLYAATVSNPAGTTFYLLGGTHVLGGSSPSIFDQVIPKTGNSYVGAPGAVLNGRNVSAYAFTGSASNVAIQYIEVINFVCPFDEFTVNHDTGDNWTIQYCNMHGNTGAAIGIGTGSVVDHCWLHHDLQYGFSSYKPPVNSGATSAITNVLIDHCEISFCGDYSDEFNPDGTPTYRGRNAAGKFWDTNGITVTNNWVHDNPLVGVWADTENVNMHFEGNLVENNSGVGFFYEISYNFIVTNNTFRRNAIADGLRRASYPDNFPVAAVYISESGGDGAVTSVNAGSSIDHNTFIDNWGDITLWENADRFCNSPANTSGKVYKPRGHGATLAECNNPAVKVLTVSLTAGSPIFTVTSGMLESTDEGRPASGSGIPGGTLFDEPTNANNFSGGYSYSSPAQGRLSANATATAAGVTLTLAAGTINTEPAYSACRWRTQNITIANNDLSHDRSAVLGSNTIPSTVSTGKIAIISQYGTYPGWSPYQGTIIQAAITFNQNNVWQNNTYTGRYTWMPFDTGTSKTFAEWRAAPYNQDAGSTFISGGTGVVAASAAAVGTANNAFIGGSAGGNVLAVWGDINGSELRSLGARAEISSRLATVIGRKASF